MNYRHAFHAGNFADCFKHSLLVALLDSLGRKPTPYFVLDTHAGAGRYDLEEEPARRTNEAANGIRRLILKPSPPLRHYLDLVEQLGLYPGSPTLTRAVLRANDRLVCCELHPIDVITLRRQFHQDPQVDVHQRSGWEALGALLPPKEKRGLIFIDPPFEARDEFSTLVDGLCRGLGQFGHGIFAGWYPIKHLATVRDFHRGLASSGLRDIIAVELHLKATTNPDGLNGCGLIVVNSPYQFECQAQSIANSLLDGLGNNETGAATAVIRLVDE